MHLSMVVAPSASLQYPRGQAVQAEAPVELPKKPAGQRAQSLALVAPAAVRKVPSGQGIDEVLPSVSTYVPGAAGPQAADCDEPAGNGFSVPLGHGVQNVMVVAPVRLLNVPGGHAEHTVSPELAA